MTIMTITTIMTRKSILCLGVGFVLLLVGSGVLNAQAIVDNIPISRPIDVVIHPVTGTVYIADDRSPSSIHVVDGNTNAVIKTIPLSSGWNALRGQAVDVGNNVLYVSHHNLRYGNVSVVDLASNTKLVPDLTAHYNTHDVAVNPVSGKFYAANANSYDVTVFNLTTRAKIKNIYTGPGRALGVSINTATNKVYVATEGGNAVRVIDGNSDGVIASIPTGSGVNDVIVHEGLNRVYASNRYSGTVSVIDCATNSVIANVGVPSGPRGLDINPAMGRVYAACHSGHLAIIDVASNTMVYSIYTGSSAHDAEVNRQTGKVYVANLNGGTVTVIQDAVTPPNQNPVADAGPGQTVHPGNTVTLDGSGSTDPDENYPLIYSWTITQKPAGSQAHLNNPSTAGPSMFIDLPGDYTVQLTVEDSLAASSQPALVHISTVNSIPAADAGPDQAVTLVGQNVTLDGSQSWDQDGDPITFQWVILQKPAGSSAALVNPTTSAPSFIPDVYGDYICQLVASDPWSQGAPDHVTVSFQNIKPVADAGTPVSCIVGETVTLDGGSSFDANGDPLTYSWSLGSVPAGSSAFIQNPTGVNPTIQPDAPGEYIIHLTVNDGMINSEPDTVTIAAITMQDAAVQLLQNASSTVSALPSPAFKNKNMPKTLAMKINVVLLKIENGNYKGALEQLKHDIIEKTDGCAISDCPDKNDWITDCQSQSQVYPKLAAALDLLKGLNE